MISWGLGISDMWATWPGHLVMKKTIRLPSFPPLVKSQMAPEITNRDRLSFGSDIVVGEISIE